MISMPASGPVYPPAHLALGRGTSNTPGEDIVAGTMVLTLLPPFSPVIKSPASQGDLYRATNTVKPKLPGLFRTNFVC
jgi:hypothetical protein